MSHDTLHMFLYWWWLCLGAQYFLLLTCFQIETACLHLYFHLDKLMIEKVQKPISVFWISCKFRKCLQYLRHALTEILHQMNMQCSFLVVCVLLPFSRNGHCNIDCKILFSDSWLTCSGLLFTEH